MQYFRAHAIQHAALQAPKKTATCPIDFFHLQCIKISKKMLLQRAAK